MRFDIRGVRASGAQNTFFIFDLESFHLKAPSSLSQFTREVCNSFYGFKTDGTLFLEKHDLDYSWSFFNSDGTQAEMCGNAARCVAAYLDLIKECDLSKRIRLQTGAGPVCLGKRGHLYEVGMPKISKELSSKQSGFEILKLDSGVPHVVLEAQPEKGLARQFRHDLSIDPRGSNVTFVEVMSPTHGSAVTFERGVEDFTRACGTGAVAAARFLQQRAPLENFFELEMPGGKLQVEFVQDDVWLIGPAQIEFTVGFNSLIMD